MSKADESKRPVTWFGWHELADILAADVTRDIEALARVDMHLLPSDGAGTAFVSEPCARRIAAEYFTAPHNRQVAREKAEFRKYVERLANGKAVK